MDYSNISNMLSQIAGQSVYTGKNASVAAEKQAAEALLKNLMPGQIFSGEITDIRGSYVTITLQSMQNIQARLAEQFEFLIGQKALFQVKDNQNNQLLIHPIEVHAAQSGELLVAERALTAAGIQMTEKTLELVRNLMKEGQPIDRQNILMYMRQLAKYPQADSMDLIALHKHQLPVNGENVSQMANYRQLRHSLLRDMGELKQKLSDTFCGMAAQSPEQAQAFAKSVVTALMPEETVQKAHKDAAPKVPAAQETADSDILKKAASLQNSGEQSEKAEQIPHTERKPEQSAWIRLSELIRDSSVLSSKEGIGKAVKLLKDTLDESFLLKPEEVADKERVKEHYRGMREKGEALRELFQSLGKEAAPLEKPAQSMTQNLKFMQSLNEAFSYIQLPLKMANQEAHGDLYVYTKRKAKGKEQEGLSAFLHLDMEHLGAVDVLVRLDGSRIGTNFTLETEELLDFVEQHIELLTARLEKKGYQCSTQVLLKKADEPGQSFEERLTGETAATGDIRRFSFDVRA